MRTGGSLRGMRELWRRSSNRLIENPKLLANPDLKPIAARYRLAIEGIKDPDKARALLGIKRSVNLHAI